MVNVSGQWPLVFQTQKSDEILVTRGATAPEAKTS